MQNVKSDLGSTMARYEKSKRQVYIAGSLLLCIVLFCAWVFRAPWDEERLISAPLFIVILLALVGVTWRNRMRLIRIETLLLLTVSAMPLCRQVWLYYLAGSPEQEWLRLLGNTYWATSAVLVAVFTIADRRRALITGVAIVLASVVIAAIGLGTGLAHGELTDSVATYIIGSLLFLSVFLTFMSVSTIMRDQWHSAVSRAAVYSRWALTDKLTGLANRRAGTDVLAHECELAKQRGRAHAVIMGDIDDFKQVNDESGHAVGDAILRKMADILRATVRESDTVARWGGEEFLIIVSDSDLEGARVLAERCRRAIAAKPIAGRKMTMTFGVAQYQHGDSQKSLLARADANLYAGKKAARNRVEANANPLTGAEADVEPI